MSTLTTKISRLSIHEHGASLHHLLGLLERETSAASLLVPWDVVQCASAERNGSEPAKHAASLMDAHNFSGVPLTWQGEVRGVYVRHQRQGRPQFEGIRPQHFVRSDISMLNMLRHMRESRCIVLGIGTAAAPEGWLTYADFSKRPFRVLLFAIVAEVEMLMAHALDLAHPDDSWVDLIPADPKGERDYRAEVLGRQKEAKGWDVAMPLTTFADISHLTRAIPESPAALRLLGEDKGIAGKLKDLSGLRNRVAHVVKPVVAGPKEIATVADQIDTLLGWIERWPAAMRAAGQNGTPS